MRAFVFSSNVKDLKFHNTTSSFVVHQVLIFHRCILRFSWLTDLVFLQQEFLSSLQEKKFFCHYQENIFLAPENMSVSGVKKGYLLVCIQVYQANKSFVIFL